VHDVSFWIDMSTNNIPAFIEEPYMPPASVLTEVRHGNAKFCDF